MRFLPWEFEAVYAISVRQLMVKRIYERFFWNQIVVGRLFGVFSVLEVSCSFLQYKVTTIKSSAQVL